MGKGELHENALQVLDLSKEETEGFSEEGPADTIYNMTDDHDPPPEGEVF